ncbi:MAG TPA: M48 family metallopeptidase [Longimicrobiales bacterium]|nr:M48 family metallopeptidase [Longimicrobiales bacterium]
MSTIHPKTLRILRDIDPASWEHPADRAALQALRRIPAFDEVLKKIFGLFGERPVRLAFQANAIRVGPRQYPQLWQQYVRVSETLDVSDPYDLFISQTPLVNAGAYGMDRPFVVLNSGSLLVLRDEEVSYLLGHEVGHILSGHVLYRTMTVLLLQLAQLGFPVVGLAARAILVGLLEWNRKAELSADRAGLLAVQDPDATLRGFMKLAGGVPGMEDQLDLNEFMTQAEQYRHSEDVGDVVFKVLNLLGTTHPFHVLRAAEIRDWIEKGEYDRIMRGEYRRRGDGPTPYQEDLAAATQAYKEDAQDLMRDFRESMKGARDRFAQGFRRP